MKSRTLGEMSKNAWLTPDETTETRQCWRVFVPDSEKMQAAFRGALFNLALPSNWEEFGDATPEDTAEMWSDANALTFTMENCQEGGGGMAIGTVFWFASETPPTGALLCDGGEYPTATYPGLYAVIANAFGGDATDFNVPDLQGQFIRGNSETEDLADTGGEDEVQLSVAELPAHQHIYGKGGGAGGVPISSPLAAPRKIGTYLTDVAGSNFPHENLPPYMALVAMIQAE